MRNSFARKFGRWAWLAFWLLLTTTAHAGSADEKSARGLFTRARAAMDRGDYDAACALLETALEIHEGLGIRFNLADCWENQGRTASAHAQFTKVATIARATGQLERQQLAETRAAHLQSTLSYLVLQLPRTLSPSSIRIDGESLPRARWSRQLPLDPGRHELAVEATGYAPYRTSVAIPVGPAQVQVQIPPRKPLAPAAPPNHSAEPADDGNSMSREHSTPNWRTWAFVGGVVVAGSGAMLGVVSTVSARDAHNLASRECPAERSDGCTQEQIDNYDKHYGAHQRWSTLAAVSYGVGAVGALSVVTLLLIGDEDEHEEAEDARSGFTVHVGRSEADVNWSVQF